jgi:hypothetical protein
MAAFQVDRVWKGRVPRILEMLAIEEQAACFGFYPPFLKVDTEWIVYARDWGSLGYPNYVTDICSRTALAKDSSDFRDLGAGRKPRSK